MYTQAINTGPLLEWKMTAEILRSEEATGLMFLAISLLYRIAVTPYGWPTNYHAWHLQQIQQLLEETTYSVYEAVTSVLVT